VPTELTADDYLSAGTLSAGFRTTDLFGEVVRGLAEGLFGVDAGVAGLLDQGEELVAEVGIGWGLVGVDLGGAA
jgi:hypothetical protein